MTRALTLVAVLLLAPGCGSSKHTVITTVTATVASTTAPTRADATATTPATTTSGTTPQEIAFRIYLLRDGKVAPVARTAPATPAVAASALRALAAGPTNGERSAGLTTEVPPATTAAIEIGDGVATVDVPRGVPHAGLAQIVYTLTQFPTVNAVRPSRSFGGATTLTRAHFEDVTPAILVESPLPGDRAASPLRVRGTANTFEATFDLEIRNSSDVRVAWRSVTATSGSGQRGTYDTTISFPRTGGPLTLVAYEPSAENGKPLHVVRIPLRELAGR